jgi:hypothetical protein
MCIVLPLDISQEGLALDIPWVVVMVLYTLYCILHMYMQCTHYTLSVTNVGTNCVSYSSYWSRSTGTCHSCAAILSRLHGGLIIFESYSIRVFTFRHAPCTQPKNRDTPPCLSLPGNRVMTAGPFHRRDKSRPVAPKRVEVCRGRDGVAFSSEANIRDSNSTPASWTIGSVCQKG